MYISEIQQALIDIVYNNHFSEVCDFMCAHGANRHELTDERHAAYWIEGAPVKVKEMFLERFNDEDWPEIRICDTCGVFMKEGYLLGDFQEHYCSEECAIKSYMHTSEDGSGEGDVSRIEAAELFRRDLEENSDDCFWTEWR